MTHSEVLVIVDPQNDFCDPHGSLYVGGAAEDIARLAGYIEKKAGLLEEIIVSLDSHDGGAIFHPAFWTDEAGERPGPFTQITPADFKAGRWRPASDINTPFAGRTFAVLEAKKITLTVWPEHCVVSTWGHQIAEPLQAALRGWREKTGRAVRYLFKGENPHTDQFSIFEGVDDGYPETAFNEPFFTRLAKFGRVTFAGEALSHCVQESMLSYLRRRDAWQDVYLLTDCASPVAGFGREASLSLLREAGAAFAFSGE